MEERLIELVRKSPCLYDRKHTSYRNIMLKDRTWSNFSKELGAPVNVLKKRWRNMRDRFFRLRKIEQADTGSEQKGTDGIITYKYYDSLKFLNVVEPYHKNKNTGNRSLEDGVEQDVKSRSESVIIIDEDSNCNEELPLSFAKRKRRNSDVIEAEMYEVLENIKSSIRHPTPFRSFLESIALTIEHAVLSTDEIICLQMNILHEIQKEIEKKNH